MPNKVRFPGDEEVLGYLTIQTWNHFNSQRASGVKTGLPPDRIQFDLLLRACFAASLKQDEGRPTAFTVFYDSEALYADYLFEEPLALSPHILAQLSSALDSSRSYLCVGPEQDGLNIVGIRHWGDHSTFTAAGGRPSHVVVHVAGPGILAVAYDKSTILTYRHGEVAYYPNQFAAHNNAVTTLIPEMPATDPARLGKLREAVTHIAEAMLRQRHGGTFLMVPEGSSWKSRVFAASFAARQPTTRVRDALVSATLGQRVRSTATDERATRLRLAEFSSNDLDIQLGVELEWLAQLTATDGMTVVTTDLTLVGFGVFFKSSDPGIVARIKNPYAAHPDDPLRPVASLGGARHQSAAVTCYALPGSVALVASQDGTLTAMRRDLDDHLLVHKHLELLLRT